MNSEPIEKCRVCNHMLPEEPLLRYENMPKSAQFLPDASTIAMDKGASLEISQCSGCGLVQLTNPPVSYYREVIRAAAVSEEMKAFRKSQFSDFIRRFSLSGKKVVEIGCGRGDFLSILAQCGVDAYGIEYSEDSVGYCKNNGLKTTREFIKSASDRLTDAPFDAFFILNFLEHLPDPNSTICGIAGNLSKDAVGLVEVPNFDMILRNRLFSEFINDHLFYFTRDTLCATLQLNGLEVIECQEIWHNYILSAVVKKRGRLDLSGLGEARDNLKRDIEAYLKRYPAKKVAIWGAGHQALAVIALTELAGEIRYVIDSASFKQGKFTPATHIPIVSPNALVSDPVDAVIVMAASYSDEVAGIIRNEYGNSIKVAVLRDFKLEHD
jgi:2-polyprenyl-3-methyl-5-hydroxy-6-metoxy-1,4-benzoquinol methylase